MGDTEEMGNGDISNFEAQFYLGEEEEITGGLLEGAMESQTLNERMDELHSELVPVLKEMLEWVKVKAQYEALGTPEEIQEDSDHHDELLGKMDDLLEIYSEMTIDTDSYVAKGWNVVLVSDSALGLLGVLRAEKRFKLTSGELEDEWAEDGARTVHFLDIPK